MNRRGKIDKLLLVLVIAIALLGIVFVYSATWDKDTNQGELNPRVIKQCLWVGIGFVIMFAIANIDYRRIVDVSYFIYAVNIIALIYILFFAGERFGARRWIDFGPFSVQPSEFMKITVILVLSSFLGYKKERIGSFGTYIQSILLIMPAFLLIFLQPDLGTAMVLMPIMFAMLYISGERVRYILSTLFLGVACLPVLWSVLKDYQRNRLLVFINPDLDPLGAGYTIIQSKIAIGSGGMFGKGWLNGTQSYLKFLPERHTDFIFSVIGEEWGFVGAFLFIMLYVLVIVRGIRIIANVNDIYAKVIVAGIVTLIAFQVFVNISMTIGLMPVVGLPLPAISYGGSNTIASLICAGLLLSISRKVGG